MLPACRRIVHTTRETDSTPRTQRNVIGGYEESGAMLPILPEDGSTVQAFLLRSERRYIQMGLDPHGRVSAIIDHLVCLALTYWMCLRRAIDLSD